MDYKNQFDQLVQQMRSESIQADIAKQLTRAEMNLRSLSPDKKELDELGDQPIPGEPYHHENRMQRRARERAERKQMNKAKGMK